MIHFALLFSRQGKVRLSKYYKPYSQKERAKMVKEVTTQILARPSKLCNVVEHRNLKLVYRRYASLYFCLAVDDTENELIVLEIIQHYVRSSTSTSETCASSTSSSLSQGVLHPGRGAGGGELQEAGEAHVGWWRTRTSWWRRPRLARWRRTGHRSRIPRTTTRV